jgi:hypothetical protein
MRWRRASPGRPDRLTAVPPDLLTWAQAVDVSRVSEHTVKATEDYLRRYRRMNLFAGREIGLRLVSAMEREVSPPPPLDARPSDIMATVLAVRRKQLGISDWPGWADCTQDSTPTGTACSSRCVVTGRTGSG